MAVLRPDYIVGFRWICEPLSLIVKKYFSRIGQKKYWNLNTTALLAVRYRRGKEKLNS